MAGAVEIADLGIVLGTLVDVLDHQRDRGSGRNLQSRRVVGHHAGKYLHFVGLAALGGEARLARAAAVEIVLDIGDLERNLRRGPTPHTAPPRARAVGPLSDP